MKQVKVYYNNKWKIVQGISKMYKIFLICNAILAKHHLLKSTIMFIMPIIIVCCNGLWPVIDVQEKEVTCLAGMLLVHANSESIPSLPPSLLAKGQKKKKMSKKISSPREKFLACNRLIRKLRNSKVDKKSGMISYSCLKFPESSYRLEWQHMAKGATEKV